MQPTGPLDPPVVRPAIRQASPLKPWPRYQVYRQWLGLSVQNCSPAALLRLDSAHVSKFEQTESGACHILAVEWSIHAS